MAQDFAFLDVGPPFVHVKIRAANVGGGDLHEHVSWFLDAGIGDSFNTDVSRSAIYECFHNLGSIESDSSRI
jgi:hypothetical protein